MSSKKTTDPLYRLYKDYPKIQKMIDGGKSPFETLRMLREVKRNLPRAEKKVEAIRSDIVEREKQLSSLVRDHAITFSEDLLSALRNSFSDASMSDEDFFAGLYVIRVDYTALSAAILFAEDEIAKDVPLDVSAIEKKLKDVVRAHEDSILSETELLAKIRDVYLTRAKGRRRLSIVWLYREMWKAIQPQGFWNQPTKARVRDYPRDKFIYDLNNLLSRRITTPDGYSLRVVPATADLCGDFRHALPFPQPRGGAKWIESIELVGGDFQ